jgi:hypothetical protein
VVAVGRPRNMEKTDQKEVVYLNGD